VELHVIGGYKGDEMGVGYIVTSGQTIVKWKSREGLGAFYTNDIRWMHSCWVGSTAKELNKYS